MARPDRHEVSYTFGLSVLILLLGFEYVRPQVTLLTPLQHLRPAMVLQILMFVHLLSKRPLRTSETMRWMCIYVAVMASGIVFAYSPRHAFGITRYTAQVFITSIFPIIFFIRTRESYEKFKKYFVLFNLFVAIWSLNHGGRGTGHFLGDENDLSLAMGVIMPFTYFSIYSSRTPGKKLFYSVASFIFLAAIVASGSRGGFVGLVCCLAYIFVYTPRKIQIVKSALVVTVVAAVCVPANYWEEMYTITDGTEDETADERVYSWELGWKMFQNSPIMGEGAGSYEIRAWAFADREGEHRAKRHLWGRAAHSLYFTLLPELGIIGACVYLYLLRMFFRNNRPVLKDYKHIVKEYRTADHMLSEENDRAVKIYYDTLALNAAMIAFLAGGTFISVLYYPHYWILLSLSSALGFIAQQQNHQELEPEHENELKPQSTT
jgi:O-antigen ligase